MTVDAQGEIMFLPFEQELREIEIEETVELEAVALQQRELTPESCCLGTSLRRDRQRWIRQAVEPGVEAQGYSTIGIAAEVVVDFCDQLVETVHVARYHGTATQRKLVQRDRTVATMVGFDRSRRMRQVTDETFKGTTIEYIRRLIRERGEAAEAELLSKLAPDEIEIFQNTLPLTWISPVKAGRILEISSQILYPDHPHPNRELGRTTAIDNLTGIYRILLRIATVPMVIQKTAKLWTTYHKKGNASASREPGKNIGYLVVSDYPDLPAEIRENIIGYVGGVLSLTGAKNIEVIPDASNISAWQWKIAWE